MASVYVQRAFSELTVADWNGVIDVDLRGAFLCAHARRRTCVQAAAALINFSDWVARSGRPRYLGYVPYYVAKTGVVALTEALALELATDHILVNAIAPDRFSRPRHHLRGIAPIEEATPLGRWGGEMEIVKGVARAARERLHHGRDDPHRRRQTPEIVVSPQSGVQSLISNL